MTSKAERVAEFLKRLEAAPPAKSSDEAYALVANTLNGVENELTSIPYDPERWMDDGRMYPPQADSARESPLPDVVRYRSKAHNTLIHVSGAIRIETVGGQCLLNKPGHNGHLVKP